MMVCSPVIVFRADASLEIGTGHVMRCLTLADAMHAEGFDCQFICRAHRGHRVDAIRARGYTVHVLPSAAVEGKDESENAPLAHGHWLGASWQTDARECARIIATAEPAWLVVDHYALDSRWEAAVKPSGCRLLVIDDLADRQHIADLLLDQNLGRKSEDYTDLVPSHCRCLIGPVYALLRPEFAQLRQASLERRRTSQLKHLLVTLGGIDKDNVTSEVLQALRKCPLPDDCRITVVMGGAAPWLDQVKVEAAAMRWPTQVFVDIQDMARRMAEADLAIGAAGSTVWERCCLGLPTIMVILADNQRSAASALEQHGAAVRIRDSSRIQEDLRQALHSILISESLYEMSKTTAQVTNGLGSASLKELLLTVPYS